MTRLLALLERLLFLVKRVWLNCYLEAAEELYFYKASMLEALGRAEFFIVWEKSANLNSGELC
jgi:hypothetical protein